MLSIAGVAAQQSKETCSLPVTWPVHTRKDRSYVQEMPIEVVSDIFSFASHSSQDPISQSISLSHVCRQWRQISLSMPSLWAFIQLELPLSKSLLTRTHVWIIRSRNQPLNIYMDFRDPSWDWYETSHVFDYKAMERIMSIFLPHASRWRSIELLTDTWAPIFTFLSCTVVIDSVPLLQTIRLARCNEYFVARGETFRPANLANPVAWFRGGTSLTHLRHVSLSGVHIDWAQSGLAGLRELELKYHAQNVMPTVSEFRHIMCANATLQRLVILGWGPRMDHKSDDGHGSDELHPLELPQLEEFKFGFVDVAYARDMLSLFALPKLRVLLMEDIAFGVELYERQDCSQLFDRLVQMSGTERPRIPLSSLHELSLRSIHADDASIQSLFSRLRDMTSLRLDRIGAKPLLAICSAIETRDRLQELTLVDIDAATTALVISSKSFPSRLRIFLDIDIDSGADKNDEEDITSD